MQNNRSNEKNNKQKKLLFFFLRLLISALVIIILFRTVDIHKIETIIKQANLSFMIPAYFLILFGAFPSALAWKILIDMQGLKINYFRIVYFNLVGFFFNTYLPTGVGGDLWRGYAVWKEGDGSPGSAASFIAERFLALGAVISLGLVSFIFWIERFRQAGIMNPMIIIMTVLIAGFLFALLFGKKLIPLFRKIAVKFLPSLKEFNIEESFKVYEKNPMKVITAFALSFASPLLECAAFICIIKALSLSVPLFPVFILVPLLRFINHLPVSYSSIGTQDVALVLFWQPLGLSPAEALSISILMHALRLTAGLTGGAMYVLFPPKAYTNFPK